MSAPTDSRASDIEDLLPDLGVSDVLQQRPSGIGSWRHAVRIAIAVTVSWAIATALSHSTFGLFAPATTLLVVQASPWTTLGVSVQRVLGTGLGVLLASVYVNLLGLTWWSFLGGVLVALLIARALPWSLGGQLQIPVAVVFVLAIGPGSLTQDLWRVLDVVIGGAVGLAAVFVFPPRPRPSAFEEALGRYRDAIVASLGSVGAECGTLAAPLAEGETHAFVGPSRRLREDADTARTALLRLVEAAQLNMRAGGVSEELEGYATRLRRLSGIGVQVRGVVGAANRLYDRADIEPTLTAAEFDGLVGQVVELMQGVLGTGDQKVGDTDRLGAVAADRALAARLRTTADHVAAQRERVGDVLESVALLGRLDHVRSQLAAFPAWQA
jgi:hypothetical protein